MTVEPGVELALPRQLRARRRPTRGETSSHSRYGDVLGAVEHVVGRHVEHRGTDPPGALGHVAGTEGVDEERPVGVALAGVDRGPRRRVHDGVGAGGGDGAEHGVAVGDVDGGVVDADDLVVAAGLEGGDELGPDLASGSRDQDAHGISPSGVPTRPGSRGTTRRWRPAPRRGCGPGRQPRARAFEQSME